MSKKQVMCFILLAAVVFGMSGCARLSTLKKCQQDNTGLQAEIDTLIIERDTCQENLNSTRLELKDKKAEVKEKEVRVMEQSQAFKEMQAAMKAEMESKQVTIQELEGRLTVSLVESILFDSGKADIKEEGVETLQKVAEVLINTTDQEIMVAGYTDNVPIGGVLARKYPTNWELSAARAISVVKLLVENGVAPELLSAAGMGEYRPVADNETPEGRAQNRRMEIILMPKRSENQAIIP